MCTEAYAKNPGILNPSVAQHNLLVRNTYLHFIQMTSNLLHEDCPLCFFLLQLHHTFLLLRSLVCQVLFYLPGKNDHPLSCIVCLGYLKIYFLSHEEMHNLKWKDHSKNLGIDGKIILEWILGKWGGRVWTERIWLRIGTNGRPLWIW